MPLAFCLVCVPSLSTIHSGLFGVPFLLFIRLSEQNLTIFKLFIGRVISDRCPRVIDHKKMKRSVNKSCFGGQLLLLETVISIFMARGFQHNQNETCKGTFHREF